MTAIYLIAAAVAVVWAVILLMRGSLVGGGLLFVVVGACFGYYFLHFAVGPLPVTLDRLVLVFLLATYALQRRLGRTDPKPLGPTDWILLLMMGAFTISALVGGWNDPWPQQRSALFRLATGYLFPLAVYWVARQAPLDRSKITLAQGVLVGLGVYLGATALLEITKQWWAVFPAHIADPNLGLHFGRARGPMLHSVSLGMYLAASLLAAWALQRHCSRPWRLAVWITMPLMLAAIAVTYTRSVWMGTALGGLVVLWFTLRGAARPLVIGGLLCAGLLLAAARMDRLVSFQRDVGTTAEDTRKSVDLRGSFAYVSWRMFLDRPLCGVGFDQFYRAKLPYLSDRSTALNLEATRPMVHHNTFLDVLVETGLVGLALYLAVLGGWAQSAWRLARDSQAPEWAKTQGIFTLAVFCVYICQALFHELSFMSIDNILMFFVAGLTVGLRAQKRP